CAKERTGVIVMMNSLHVW
nr:immunoglobulin heavy chain junction region [Macaca mulatta]MOW22103.1 immunoglobulin heavy chain junction region [Macaca mulatta]MOW22300.1 immunoglobulin heavy chain junction region [Macaca mulatta]